MYCMSSLRPEVQRALGENAFIMQYTPYVLKDTITPIPREIGTYILKKRISIGYVCTRRSYICFYILSCKLSYKTVY